MTKPIDRLLEIMAQLRNPEGGCPWDVEQDFQSIAPHTLEEAYEVVDAIYEGDMNNLREELGDLLLQVVFHAQMAKEENLFDFDDVAQAINDKLIRRHPHVFGNADIKTAEAQTEAWEQIKAEERAAKGQPENPTSLLDDVPQALPALTRAAKLQKRAAKVGFDWPDIAPVFGKIDEEMGELKEAISAEDTENIRNEMGDVLFACANLARKLGVDPEDALRHTNRKFTRRFQFIEQSLAKKGKTPIESDLTEMDALWETAKKSAYALALFRRGLLH